MRRIFLALHLFLFADFCFAQQTGVQDSQLTDAAKRIPVFQIKSCTRDSKFDEQLKDILTHKDKLEATECWTLAAQCESTENDESKVEALKIISPEDQSSLIESFAILNQDLKALQFNQKPIRLLDAVHEQGWMFGKDSFYRPSLRPPSPYDSVRFVLTAPDETKMEIQLSETFIQRIAEERDRRRSKNKEFTCRVADACEENKSLETLDLDTATEEIQKALKAYQTISTFLRDRLK